jgi:hypothetical protein
LGHIKIGTEASLLPCKRKKAQALSGRRFRLWREAEVAISVVNKEKRSGGAEK